jgi:hypothetical protein
MATTHQTVPSMPAEFRLAKAPQAEFMRAVQIRDGNPVVVFASTSHLAEFRLALANHKTFLLAETKSRSRNCHFILTKF